MYFSLEGWSRGISILIKIDTLIKDITVSVKLILFLMS